MFLDYAIEGYRKQKLNIVSRILCAVAGITLVYPNYIASAIGLGIGVVAIVLDRASMKKNAAA